MRRRRALFESILRHPDSEHVAAAYQFWSSFLCLTRCDHWWKEDVDSLPCYWEMLCATKIDRYQDKPLWAPPPPPPPFALSFLCGVWFTLPSKTLPQKNPTLWWTRKHLIQTVVRLLPVTLLRLGRQWCRFSEPRFRAAFRCNSAESSLRGRGSESPATWAKFGQEGRRGVGKKWFRMPGIFSLQKWGTTSVNEEWWQPFLVLIPGLLANFFLQMLVCQQGFNWLL